MKRYDIFQIISLEIYFIVNLMLTKMTQNSRVPIIELVANFLTESFNE